MRKAILLLLLSALVPLTGCVHVDRSGTVINVRAQDEAEEARVRRELWRVEKALAEVRFHYGLTDIPIEVIVTDMGGLGQTSPALNDLARVDGAIVTINQNMLLETGPDTDIVLLGLFAHELAHAMHYDRIDEQDLIALGKRYDRYLKTLNPEYMPWVRAYEQLTDMTAIRMGYAEALVYQKRASEANLAANHPPKVWNFYLTEDEIVAYAADPELLQSKIEEALVIVRLPSIHFVAKEPVFDEYEFLRGFGIPAPPTE